MAAVGAVDASLPQQPTQRDAGTTPDIWQLVQNTAPGQGETASQGVADPATILAAFASSTPESVEEELAKQHGLEILKRVTLSSLDLRVVTYRAREGSAAVAAIVPRLRADPRVSSAQANVTYRAIEPVETEVSVAEHPRNIGQRDAKQPVPMGKRAPARSASVDVMGQPPKSKTASERTLMHSGRAKVTAADVLAGGL
ncbi:MAG: hypothetical protein ACKVP3_15955 [Hyphomicrobiaceae bacterium]